MPDPAIDEDASLLAAFTRERSDQAFQALVERHGGMVYATCRRGLGGRTALAEDAAQAVFLLLAEKAHTIRHGGALASWLFRAAVNTVARMCQQEAARKRREEKAATEAQRRRDMEVDGHTWDEARPLLNDAIAALRESQRQAVVLHCLEGRTQRETAALLGCSEDAVRMRVAGALKRLRSFLRRQGLALSVAALLSGLEAEAADAARAALAVRLPAPSSASTPGEPGRIARHVSRDLAWAKFRVTVIALLVVMGTSVYMLSDASRLDEVRRTLGMPSNETTPPPMPPRLPRPTTAARMPQLEALLQLATDRFELERWTETREALEQIVKMNPTPKECYALRRAFGMRVLRRMLTWVQDGKTLGKAPLVILSRAKAYEGKSEGTGTGD